MRSHPSSRQHDQRKRRSTLIALRWTLLAYFTLWLGCDTGAQDTPDGDHGLEVRPEHRCSPYDSDDYRYSQSVEQQIVDQQGGIFSPYTLRTFDSTQETDIEHIVARSEAHDSGMCQNDSSTKRAFSNDLLNLTLASPGLNRHQKSAKDPGEWLPDYNKCWYAYTVTRVKRKYQLSVDSRESRALNDLLGRCTDVTMQTPGARPPAPALAPRRSATCGPFRNCTELRKAYPGGVRRGHCAYQKRFSRDNDGHACE